MTILRIIFGIFGLCLAPVLTIGVRGWAANLWGIVLLVLLGAQIFYPTLTRYAVLWLLVALALPYVFPEGRNPWMWH